MLSSHLCVRVEHSGRRVVRSGALPQLFLVLFVERRLIDELNVRELLQQSLVNGQLLEHLK